MGVGGDRMRAAGMDVIFHVRELAVMGFLEVLKHLPVLKAVERTLEAVIAAKKPDALVLIDYPGFNLRFARKVRRPGMKTVYYISPQIWAWNPGRVKKMRALIDTMLVVFPFEEEIYMKAGINAQFVGHPLLETMSDPQDRKAFCRRYDLDESAPVLRLFRARQKSTDVSRCSRAAGLNAKLGRRWSGSRPARLRVRQAILGTPP
jgi:lipid-A-disaccharide synthase